MAYIYIYIHACINSSLLLLYFPFVIIGLCLHQCKLPAQQFFVDTLGLPLTVSPNFETQECQWSFGEVPLDPVDDPTFPSGCLAGCASRSQLKDRQRDQCSTISVTNL